MKLASNEEYITKLKAAWLKVAQDMAREDLEAENVALKAELDRLHDKNAALVQSNTCLLGDTKHLVANIEKLTSKLEVKS